MTPRRPGPGVEELFAVGLVALPWWVAGVEVALLHAGPAERVLGPLGEAGEATSAVGVAFAAQASTFAVLTRCETALVHRLRRSLADLERLQAVRAASIPALVVVPGGS